MKTAGAQENKLGWFSFNWQNYILIEKTGSSGAWFLTPQLSVWPRDMHWLRPHRWQDVLSYKLCKTSRFLEIAAVHILFLCAPLFFLFSFCMSVCIPLSWIFSAVYFTCQYPVQHNTAWLAHNQHFIIKITYYCLTCYKSDIVENNLIFFSLSYQEIWGHFGNFAVILCVSLWRPSEATALQIAINFWDLSKLYVAGFACSRTAISTDFAYKQVLLTIL